MKRIGIFTTFGAWDEAYSPVNVVNYQLLSLIRHGYKPVLFTLDVFNHAFADFPLSQLEVRNVIPTIKFEPYQGIAMHRNVPNSLELDVAKIVPVLEKEFNSMDILLCHDIIFQDSFLAYNAALRKMVLPKHLRMYHWTHSGPSARPANLQPPIEYLYTLPPQSDLVYMNRYDVIRAAEMYNVMPEKVQVVHNPIDARVNKRLHPLTDKIISSFDLHSADVIAVYPLSTTRMGKGGKQLDKAIKIMANIKKSGLNVRFIVPNAHANGPQEKIALVEIMTFANILGLQSGKDLFFTSLIDTPQYQQGIPHRVVTELMDFADIFIFPSVSENCPLSLLEAASAKNLLVLNEDFSPMKDFVGPHALYFKFDSVTTTTSHSGYPDGEDGFYRDVAKIIVSELMRNRTYLSYREIRQKFNMDYIFQKQLEPLFYKEAEINEIKSVSVEPARLPSTSQTTAQPVINSEKSNDRPTEFPWWAKPVHNKS